MFRKIIFLTLLLISFNIYAELIPVHVIGVHDGDTIEFIKKTKDNKSIVERGRLYGIDAPELQQDFGIESRDALRKLILDKDVYISEENVDFYGRIVINIFLNETYINEELIKGGFAWSYKQYNNNNIILNSAEIEARTKRLGLWNTPSPIYPPDWRKLKKMGNVVITNKDLKCNISLTCSDLKTCDEAVYLLNECKFEHLDKDGDGIPCESLCKINNNIK